MSFQQLLDEYGDTCLQTCETVLKIDNNEIPPNKCYALFQKVRNEPFLFLDRMNLGNMSVKKVKFISTLFNKDCKISTVTISTNDNLVDLCYIFKFRIKHFEFVNIKSESVHLFISNMLGTDDLVIAIRHCNLQNINGLFEKLRNQRVEKFLIEHSNVDESNADSIIDFIQTNQTMVAFSLFDANLQSRIVDIIKSTFGKNLQRLRFDQATLGEEGLKCFIQVFKKSKSLVAFGNIDGFTCIDWSILDFEIFINAMEANRTYNSLDFYGCTFTSDQFELLTNTIIKLPNVEELDFTMVKITDGSIEPYIRRMIKNTVGLRSISFFGIETDSNEIVRSLEENYFVTEVNPKDRYHRPDLITENVKIQELLSRNKRLQNERAKEFLASARVLPMLKLPTELLYLIFKQLCTDCMITKKEKELFYFLMDPGNLGIECKEFTMTGFIDFCTK
ncbi:hypothetical protein HDV01_001809 [Terramyces sp. JEL0728]|nr:hypothetical protein HDV01_001809 [Terramyces sp. JEL0728]